MRNDYPENQAVESGRRGKYTYSIVRVSTGVWGPYYCGYVRFPRRPVKEEGYQGILNYVPVNGGITYAKESHDGSMVYGFDCTHLHDRDRPWTQDINWVREECRRMAVGIFIAARYERRYLEASDTVSRAKIIDEYWEMVRRITNHNYEVDENTAVVINLISGQL